MSFPVAGVSKAEIDVSWEPMEIGAFRVDPELKRLSGPAGESVLEPKTMAVLVYLAARPGRVVSNDELIHSIWHDRPMGENPVYRCISQLRRAFSDDPRHPAYIATVQTRGYRLLAPVTIIGGSTGHDHAVGGAAEPNTQLRKLPPGSNSNRARFGWSVISLAAVVLLASWFWMRSQDGPTPLATGGRPGIAVEPFATTSADPDVENLAVGISAAVLSQLASFQDFRVVPQTSPLAFAASGFWAPRFALQLPVDYILQGRLDRQGDNLRVDVVLADRKGLELWSDTFDYPGTEEFGMQFQIASEVVEGVMQRVRPVPSLGPQPDFSAYTSYAIGHELMIRQPEGFLVAARKHFDSAIEEDPEFAELYAERAVLAVLEAAATADPTVVEAADRDISRALALDPYSAQAHIARGFLVWYRSTSEEGLSNDELTESAFRHALDLDLPLVNVWTWQARALRARGFQAEADRVLENAALIDPLAATMGVNLAYSEMERGRFAEAEARLLRMSNSPAPAAAAQHALIDLYMSTGRFAPALRMARERVLLDIGQDGSLYDAAGPLAGIWTLLGDFERANYWAARAEDMAEQPEIIRLYMIVGGLGLPHPDFADSVELFRQTLVEVQGEFLNVDFGLRVQFGTLLSLAGEFDAGLEILVPLLEPGGLLEFNEIVREYDPRHALCWAWMNTGKRDRAEGLLRMLEDHFRRLYQGGQLHQGYDLLAYARNQLLLGEPLVALDLLEQAIEAGWRDYFYVQRDPRWEALRGNTDFQAAMAFVKEDIDAQRTLIDATMPEAEFVARFEVVKVLREAEIAEQE